MLLLGDRRDPPDRRADEDSDARAVDVPVEPGVLPRLLRRSDGEQDVPIHPPRLLRRDEVARIEPAHLGRDPDRVLRCVERLDPADPAAPGDG